MTFLADQMDFNGPTQAQQTIGEYRHIFSELATLREVIHDVQNEHRLLSARIVEANSRLGEVNNKMDKSNRRYHELWRKVSMLPGAEAVLKDFDQSNGDNLSVFSRHEVSQFAHPVAPVISLENALSMGRAPEMVDRDSLPTNRNEPFVMVLCKSDTKGCTNIGAELRTGTDGRLTVKKIIDNGLVYNYNLNCQGGKKKCVVGDVITDVNGKTDIKIMQKETQNKKLLRMTVQHTVNSKIHASESPTEVPSTYVTPRSSISQQPSEISSYTSAYQDYYTAHRSSTWDHSTEAMYAQYQQHMQAQSMYNQVAANTVNSLYGSTYENEFKKTAAQEKRSAEFAEQCNFAALQAQQRIAAEATGPSYTGFLNNLLGNEEKILKPMTISNSNSNISDDQTPTISRSNSNKISQKIVNNLKDSVKKSYQTLDDIQKLECENEKESTQQSFHTIENNEEYMREPYKTESYNEFNHPEMRKINKSKHSDNHINMDDVVQAA